MVGILPDFAGAGQRYGILTAEVFYGAGVFKIKGRRIFAQKLITMIQRIQSLYLALCATVLVLAFFFPLLTYIDNSQIYLEVFISGLRDSSSPAVEAGKSLLLGLQIVTAGAVLLSVLSIFLYKNRPAQLKLVRFLAGLILVDIALVFFQVGGMLSALTGIETDFNHPAIYLMLAGLVFAVLAFRGIRKDEAMVRSADRLRP